MESHFYACEPDNTMNLTFPWTYHHLPETVNLPTLTWHDHKTNSSGHFDGAKVARMFSDDSHWCDATQRPTSHRSAYQPHFYRFHLSWCVFHASGIHHKTAKLRAWALPIHMPNNYNMHFNAYAGPLNSVPHLRGLLVRHARGTLFLWPSVPRPFYTQISRNMMLLHVCPRGGPRVFCAPWALMTQSGFVFDATLVFQVWPIEGAMLCVSPWLAQGDFVIDATIAFHQRR
jgi:hypothetical protein